MPELKSYYRKKLLEAGCDEAGRGCFAGPVFAAAVILPKKFYHPLLNDSKKMKPEDRQTLRTVIEEEAIAYGVAMADNLEIDRINILKASFLAMHRAIEQLKVIPELLLIDGNRFTPYPFITHVCQVKGDEKFASIAAASVLAKTYRDEWMEKLHEEYPQYGWNRNKGYGTVFHRQAIAETGICPYHRLSFRLMQEPEAMEEEYNEQGSFPRGTEQK